MQSVIYPQSSTRPNNWLPMIIFTVGVWIHLFGIGRMSLWADEAFTWFAAVNVPPAEVLTDALIRTDVHPPLYPLIMSVWVRLVGESAVGLRAFSALCGMAAMPAIYHFARRLFNRRAGLIALGLSALSPIITYYSGEARMYMLALCAVAWALYGLALMLWSGRRARGWVLFVGGAVTALYTLYMAVLPFIGAGMWVLLSRRGRARWRWWLSAAALIGLVYLPQLSTFAAQTSEVLVNYWPARPTLSTPPSTLAYLIFGQSMVTGTGHMAAFGLGAALYVLATLDALRGRGKQRYIGGLWVAISLPIGLIYVLSQGAASVYTQRIFVMLLPFALALIAAGAAYTRRPSPLPLFMAAAVILMLNGRYNYLYYRDLMKAPMQQIAADIAVLSTPTTPILHLHDSTLLPLIYYLSDRVETFRVVNLGQQSWITSRVIWDRISVERLPRTALVDWLASYQGDVVIILPAETLPPEDALVKGPLKAICPQISQTLYDIRLILLRVRCGG